MTVTIATLGFPRIGARRELKFALEQYWSGQFSRGELFKTCAALRAGAWTLQSSLGTDWVPSNDFSLYDHVLDTSVMLGAVPERYRAESGRDPLDTYFAMARGTDGASGTCHHGAGTTSACEMTKWFDTNYHFLVPELVKGQTLALGELKILDDYLEATGKGFQTRPVLLGPVSWLSLAKGRDVDPFDFLDQVIPLYAQLLEKLARAGAEWVQIDEPVLVLDLDDKKRQAFRRAYSTMAHCGAKIMLASYFGGLEDNLPLAAALPVAGLHVDLVRGADQLDDLIALVPEWKLLSLGVIDGRNIWRADLDRLLDKLESVAAVRDLVLAPSCSLLHVPVDLALETQLDADVKQWLAFATQKIEELVILKKALNKGRASVSAELAASRAAVADRACSPRVHDAEVSGRLSLCTPGMRARRNSYTTRAEIQADALSLPAFPTTTIGSFPQTNGVRRARADYRRGKIDLTAYTHFLREETAQAIRWQEEADLDMLVHGEFERNDMVQYFGEQLNGFAFTTHAWVQSYGSRCVRPPILFGDVSRPKPMTVDWWRYAQSLTERPVKGMLTGPVTILNWSFVRNDQAREVTCRQIALAIRDEVLDLEAAGCKAIQIDEAALREGLPLRCRDWQAYLDWAVDCFKLSAAGVTDATQIHTHMCYSEFNDILPAIAAMDADVISIETARSQMELLQAFGQHGYANAIGPGVYDIHAPRVPQEDEMLTLIGQALRHLRADQLWVNPDCGLKTRGWTEVKPAIEAMVSAAKALRERHLVYAAL